MKSRHLFSRLILSLSLACTLGVGALSVTPALAQLNVGTPGQVQPQQSNPFNQDLTNQVNPDLPSGYANQDASNPIVTVLRWVMIAMSFVGVGLLGLLIYAGFQYMTSGGNDEVVSKAKSTIFNAVIGLIIIMMALTLSTFIIQRVQVATSTYGNGGIGGNLLKGALD